MPTNRRYVATFATLSAGYILLGLLLILAPDSSKRVICYILGGLAIAAGIARIAWHFFKDDFSRAFHNDIPSGVVLLLVGIYLIAKPDAVWGWLPVILGFVVVFDSILKLQQAFDLKRTGFGPWGLVLVLALCTAVLGALLIVGVFSSNILLYYFGAVLIIDGAVNLGTITLLVVHTKKAEKRAEEAPPEEAPKKDPPGETPPGAKGQ